METLSLIIPVYNEAPHLRKFLSVADSLDLPVAVELVIVNDCSTDGSGEILQNYAFKSNAVVVDRPTNMGKGAALRVGFERASGDIIGVLDADFEYDVADIRRLIRPLLRDKADVVYGSRFKKSCPQVHRTMHYLANRFLTALSNIMSGLYLSDMETCFKFFRADVIKNIELETNRFGFEPEVTAKISRLNVRIVELPISYHPRNYMEGKKITWKDGVAAIWHIFRFNLGARRAERFKSTLPQRYEPRAQQWL